MDNRFQTQGIPELEILQWEQRSAASLLAANTYEERRRLYPEVYNEDNAYWLGKHGQTGISGQVARDIVLLGRCFPGDGPVLDIGGGVGVAGKAFPPPRKYIVCDASLAALRHGRERSGASVPGGGVLGYAMELPFASGVFEGVLLLDVLEHLHTDDIDRCLSEAGRVLRPGGKVLISTPNRLSGPWDIRREFPGSYGKPGLHLNEMSVSELSRLVRRHGFRPLAFACLPAGKGMPEASAIGVRAALFELLVALLPWRLRPRICQYAIVHAESRPARRSR